MPWTADIDKTNPTHPIVVRDRYPVDDGGSEHLTAAEARALAAELVRAADEVEPVTERSCFTCKFCPAHPSDDICEPDRNDSPEIGRYLSESGCYDAPDGMPTNRSLSCPGWAAKVTT